MPSRFEDDDFDVFVSQCANCRHWDADAGTRCAAYPEAIPFQILMNEVTHKEAQPGDHGLYEPRGRRS